MGESQAIPHEPPNPLDKFRGLEDLTLHSFTPALSMPKQHPCPRAIQEAMWEAARGSELIKKISIDKIMGVQGVESGGFKAPDIPHELLSTLKILETDSLLRSTHQQHCVLALVMVKGITHINDIVTKLPDTVSQGQKLSMEETQDLASELSDEVTHFVCDSLIASKSNNQHIKRRDKLVEGLRRQYEVLANAVKTVSLGHTSFFAQDMTDHIKEAAKRASI